MPDQRYNKKRIWNPEQWPFFLVLLFVVLGAVGLVSVIAAQIFIRDVVGGDLGIWLGWGVTLFIVFALSWIVARKFSNPTITSLCFGFDTLLCAGIGQEAARYFGAGAWEWPIAVFVAVVVGVPLNLMIMRPVKNVANPTE